jgi:hypothetical protein
MIRRLLEKWLGVVELRKQLVETKKDLQIAKYLGKVTDADIQDYKYRTAPYHIVSYVGQGVKFK